MRKSDLYEDILKKDVSKTPIETSESADDSCTECGEDTNESWLFCPFCGVKLKAISCEECGHELTGTETFCPDCGVKLM